MTVYVYRTLGQPAESSVKEKGSKFLAFAYPVVSEEEIKERLLVLKKLYFDAHHHCYAWILGPDKKRFRAMDDGEPNHSAGDPILGQLRSKDLTDVLLVVVRYFGGTKLGVGGLIAAYKAAAQVALETAVIVEKTVNHHFRITYPYTSTAEVMRCFHDFGVTIITQNFTEDCTVEGAIPLQEKEPFEKHVKLLCALGYAITIDE